MPRSAALLALGLLMASSCAGSLAGDWYGTCQFADDTYSYGGLVSLTLEDGGGQQLGGALSFEMGDGRLFTGEATGSRSDSSVSLSAPVVDENSERFTFDIAGTLEDDGSIAGTCALRLPGQTGAGLTGALVLEQP